jgi:Tfp pilus assembly protein PilF
MFGFRSTAMARKAISDLLRRSRLARFSPVPVLLALTLTGGGCAGLTPAPGEIAAEDNDAQFSQAMRMAESVRANGDMSAAAVFYRRAHSLAPDQLEPIIGLAQSAAAVGAKEQALQFYRKAVVLAPDNIQARLGVGRVLLAMERPDLAAPELRAAIAGRAITGRT